MVKGHTAEETLYLLSQDFSPSITVPLYKLYNHALADNDSRLDFIEALASQWKAIVGETGGEFLKDKLSLMLKNVLSSLSWEDNSIAEKYTILLSKLFKNFEKNPNDDLKNVLLQNTLTIRFQRYSDTTYFDLQYFSKIKKLELSEGTHSLTFSENRPVTAPPPNRSVSFSVVFSGHTLEQSI